VLLQRLTAACHGSDASWLHSPSGFVSAPRVLCQKMSDD